MTANRSMFAPATFGQESRWREEGGLRIVETFHLANFKLAQHEHEDPTIVAAISGGWNERVEGKSFTCRPGSFFFRGRPPPPHKTSADGAQLFSINSPLHGSCSRKKKKKRVFFPFLLRKPHTRNAIGCASTRTEQPLTSRTRGGSFGALLDNLERKGVWPQTSLVGRSLEARERSAVGPAAPANQSDRPGQPMRDEPLSVHTRIQGRIRLHSQ